MISLLGSFGVGSVKLSLHGSNAKWYIKSFWHDDAFEDYMYYVDKPCVLVIERDPICSAKLNNHWKNMLQIITACATV